MFYKLMDFLGIIDIDHRGADEIDRKIVKYGNLVFFIMTMICFGAFIDSKLSGLSSKTVNARGQLLTGFVFLITFIVSITYYIRTFVFGRGKDYDYIY